MSHSKEVLKTDAAFETPATICVRAAVFERRAPADAVGWHRPRLRPATTQNQRPTQSAFRLVGHQRPASGAAAPKCGAGSPPSGQPAAALATKVEAKSPGDRPSQGRAARLLSRCAKAPDYRLRLEEASRVEKRSCPRRPSKSIYNIGNDAVR